MTTLDLSGDWHYALEDNAEYSADEHDHAAWPTMRIPQNWFLGGLDHHGVVWFRHVFECAPGGQWHTLRFDGVDYFADVYLNGVHLGRHEGYFEPFTFDATDHIRPGKNVLAVRVDSPYEPVSAADGWPTHKRLIKGVLNHHDCRPGGSSEAEGQSYNTGGIWNRVMLVQHGLLQIEELHLQADVPPATPALRGRLTVSNRASGPAQIVGVEVRCRPDNFESGLAFSESFALEIPRARARTNSPCGHRAWHSGSPGTAGRRTCIRCAWP